MHDQDELTPEERAALESLPREREPERPLEERIVRALRAQGLLAPPVPFRLVPPAMAWLAAAAALVVVFAGGMGLGAWLEARHTTQVVLDMHQRDAAAAAALVQRTGSAYVSALSALASFSGRARPQELQSGREAAVSALQAAANQTVRLVPEEPIAVDILQGMARAARGDTLEAAAEPRRVVWF
ncbi:MAG TPA: hypothetical protein VGK89_14045 [Candidatus Eisenbacteria bacterium]|jgi:hypothetical protein